MLRQFAILLLLATVASACVPVRGGVAHSEVPDDGAAPDVEIVRGSRIYGSSGVSSPPILFIARDGQPIGEEGGSITLEFDMRCTRPPNVMLTLVHCDRNWTPTSNVFINDPIALQTSDLDVQRAPISAQHYDYSVSTTFPKSTGRLKITHSGNYIARVTDYFDQTHVLVEKRFFVVERNASVDVSIYSDFFDSGQTTVVQNGLKVQVEAQPAINLFSSQVQAIHLYESGHWQAPMKADANTIQSDFGPGETWTRWESSFSSKAVAQFANIPSGNEHRPLDLTDIGAYPVTNGLQTTPLSDLPRGFPAGADNNGEIRDRYVSTVDDDYVYFEFRLDLEGHRVREDIAVVGTFNGWVPERRWLMHYDSASGFYTARGWIKRAYHEYEYVAGDWDADNQTLRDAESTLLEGNVNQTSKLFYAFVYYRDVTVGGFDRIIGMGAAVS